MAIAEISMFALIIIVFAVGLAAGWKTFAKADQPGWAILIPIYNLVVMCRVAGKSGWWVLTFIIPVVGTFVYLYINYLIAKNFGIGTVGGILFALFAPLSYVVTGFGSHTHTSSSSGTSTPTV